ncbi:MAG: NAD(P)-binding domain-containing protein [Lewinellaceae bacterium]|jgi:thioredoxin reductase (NADPH)|nr:NAD(P)-binding domain-containing protein [Lewinellaceae bacterium]
MLVEQILIYAFVFLFCAVIVFIYLKKLSKASRVVEAKIEKAKQEGLHEPVSLHPVINLDTCIKSGACVAVCPEKDILGIVNGRATLINASSCVGHGACFHNCPVEAISLVIGTEKRGVDLPHVNQNFETNVPGIYIAGELGGMGLIKNSVEQGQAAVENIIRVGIQKDPSTYDLIIIGAGPAGISASLAAKKYGLNFRTLDQDTLGGTVFSFPRSKIVMTAPMVLPLFGKVKLYDTSKTELLDLWHTVLTQNNIQITENTKVESIQPEGTHFSVLTNRGDAFKTQKVLLAIGRRGTPRKLGIPGETLEKVAYRLLEPENIRDKNVVVVGGGDSAIEAALSLAIQNKVLLSYRSETFSRLKPKNREKLNESVNRGLLKVKFKSNLVKIEQERALLTTEDEGQLEVDNDLVYIFAGGELPTQFLQKAGVEITKRFGYTMKRHR